LTNPYLIPKRINGKDKILRWNKTTTHILTHGLHYGSSVFEGLRVYKTDKGSAIFRLNEHIDRLFYSAQTIKLDVKLSKDEVKDVIIEIIKKNKISSGYIRPLIYFGEEKMGLSPIGASTDFIIAGWPWGKYLGSHPARAAISKFIRPHPKSIDTNAKIGGYYANSIQATLDVKERGYDEAIMLDHKGNLAEGPGENLFFVKEQKIYTPKPDNILPGITRDTIISICKDLDYEVIITDLKPDFLNEVEEAFFCGTAVEVHPIGEIEDRKLGTGKLGSTTKSIQDTYKDCTRGKIPKYNSYLTYV